MGIFQRIAKLRSSSGWQQFETGVKQTARPRLVGEVTSVSRRDNGGYDLEFETYTGDESPWQAPGHDTIRSRPLHGVERRVGQRLLIKLPRGEYDKPKVNICAGWWTPAPSMRRVTSGPGRISSALADELELRALRLRRAVRSVDRVGAKGGRPALPRRVIRKDSTVDDRSPRTARGGRGIHLRRVIWSQRDRQESGADGTRTRGLRRATPTLSQLSYSPWE
jgi:hypothetical protein